MSQHVHGPNCGCAADAKQLSGALENLYPQIDTTRVWALNELVPGSGKNVFKPYDERKDTKSVLNSNTDGICRLYRTTPCDGWPTYGLRIFFVCLFDQTAN
jgi:hypothetical protein